MTSTIDTEAPPTDEPAEEAETNGSAAADLAVDSVAVDPAADETPDETAANGDSEAVAAQIADGAAADSTAVEPLPTEFGTFTDAGDYIGLTVVEDDLGDVDIDEAIADTIVEFSDGDIVSGVIVRVDRDEALLDIGFKSEGIIPARELSIRQDIHPAEAVSVGDQIEALVLQKEDQEGRLIMSKKRAQYERAWGRIEQVRAEDGVVSGPVIEVVKGGLIVDIGLRGFLPASLVELRRVRDLDPYVGRQLEAKIIELDKNRNNVVLSRRAWLEESQREERETFLQGLEPGQRRTGKVSSVVSFGAFVDLGGMDGLIHVSELSWEHIEQPSEVVNIGDEVEVKVLEIDRERERISLSLKATQPDPWEVFAESHRVEELVYGRVTKLVPFGAFVDVGGGIEGLVHISEMSAHHVDQPDQVVAPNEELWVKIIGLDMERRRIGLSIKRAAEGGEVAAEYKDHFADVVYDEEGNPQPAETPAPSAGSRADESEAERAWREYYEEHGEEAYRQALAHYEQQAADDTAADAGDTAVGQSDGASDTPAAEGEATASDAVADEVTAAAPDETVSETAAGETEQTENTAS